MAGLGVLVGLAACSAETGDEESTDGPTGAESPAACAEFFEGQVPLADRAQQDREALTAGEITDEVAYAEINGLESRIGSVAESAPEDVASLLEQVNAPFTEAVDRVNAFEAQEDGPTVPDFQDIDVTGSESAQQELEALCEEA